jgi:hypothetical protein
VLAHIACSWGSK